MPIEPTIEGLRDLATYLDDATHDALIASADANQWLQSGERRVQVHGYRYHSPTPGHPTGTRCGWSRAAS